ncbi:23S rRNA (adenine(1618)-N(6))-methyltransferase RlmF [Hymenobacter sp. BRD67]|uniref:23S rRNA (adenine(1618)-N(6))-methyltransferase RlmF n=1 Tax=Hymenobacter sp. BRD67 TaxID=2675877 RepID=UPI0015669321|nr:23S rRNA (adenine(1618)-N(6))-methyltransferase RlmF [Hymenobacter sp. BRD67]QKG51427.1 23S rRNA (adenine(1618)-N(6))-methyltransferase RlmF [Hymenobacter sp. BRD67]
MKQSPLPRPADKDQLHPRNRHRGRYDFAQLVRSSPALAAFVRVNEFGDSSIDFADPAAVKALNQALLRHFYGIENWDIPAGYLCPPIPGRADYIHYLADLLAEDNSGVVPQGRSVRVLDIGVGANCIYPILGHHEYGWRFVGAETDAVALRAARQLVAANSGLAGSIDCRLQSDPQHMLAGIVKPGEVFDATLCNPPFHASAAEAAAATQRKTTNLGRNGGRSVAPARNFGGQHNELWYPGGEETFLRQLIAESRQLPKASYWYTALVSQKVALRSAYYFLQQAQAVHVKTIEMAQGQKKSRFVAWSFLTEEERAAWRQTRWAPAAR